ncbi:hypothetical protein OG565_26255 [Streptomyces sp. NBC_00138]|uniref:hypothetical protein n=1 Tax=Streptomyces sp. NBC_00138 TaxID=2903625 RepID=UPI00325339F2
MALGGTAATMLFSRIAGDRSAPRSVVLLTRFLVRGSGEFRAHPAARPAARPAPDLAGDAPGPCT